MASAGPVNKIERAHQMYRDGRYTEALGFYTEALSMAKTKPQRIALHSNRAACYLKLHDFKKAAEECTSVLELDYDHTGALMLRAQTLVTLKEYHSALFDVNRLIELNPSSEVYQNLQARLKTQLSLAPIPEAEAEMEEEEEEKEEIKEADPCSTMENMEKDCKKQDTLILKVGNDHKPATELIIPKKPSVNKYKPATELIIPKKQSVDKSPELNRDEKNEPKKGNVAGAVALSQEKESSVQDSKGWQAIPKPKGHSTLDYARWDRVEDDSSEDEDDDEEEEEYQPQYRFRVRTVGVRPVK